MIDPRKLAALMLAAAFTAAGCFGCGKRGKDSSSDEAEAVSGEDDLNEHSLSVTFLDVEKADSMIIRSGNSTVVMDCGEKGDGKEIVRLLKDRGVTSVDYLIITHYDKDHVGGAAKVISNFDVANVIGPDYWEYSDEADKYRQALEAKHIEPQLITKDMSFSLGGAEYTVFAPKQDYYGPDNDNDFSLVTRLKYQDTTFLFAGDAMDIRLKEVMDVAGDCDLLKIPYHGRKLNALGAFLDRTSPEYAVVCTDKNDFSSYVKNLLSEKNIKYWSTAFNGRITAISDGTNITVTSEK